jgi:hypothetical protein
MQLSRKIKGKKFMWDGNEYTSEEEAKAKAENYSKDGFETELINEDGKYYVFTRRIVKEVKIEG